MLALSMKTKKKLNKAKKEYLKTTQYDELIQVAIKIIVAIIIFLAGYFLPYKD